MASVTTSVILNAVDGVVAESDIGIDVLAIVDGDAPAAEQGVEYEYTYTGNGEDTPYTWSIVGGMLPNGLSLNSSTGVLDGTPDTIEEATFTVQLAGATQTVTTGDGISVVNTNWTITNTAPGGTENSAYTHTYTTDGASAPNTWSVPSGDLPDGVTLTDAAAGTISGTPTVPGTFNWTIRCTDNNSVVIDQSEGNKVINAASPAAPTNLAAVRV